MNYENFYDLAVYGNENWKGSFSSKEIACNAYNYCADFQWSKENKKISFIIKELAKLLLEDGSEECLDWSYDMAKELGLIKNISFIDYMETDIEIIKKIWEE